MSLKILFIPFSFILTLVVLIGYVKPLYAELLLKQASYLSLQQQLNQVNDRLDNINAVLGDFSSDFTDTLGGKSEREVVMDQYIPEAIDQDRVVDAFNYLAGQSGVLISSVNMDNKGLETTPVAAAQEQVVNSQSVILNGTNTTIDISLGNALALSASYPSPKKYRAKLNLSGNYESFMNFFGLVHAMNRENEIESFSLKKNKDEKDAEGKPKDNSLLVGDVSVLFMYYPGLTKTGIQNAEALDIFSVGKIDTKSMEYITTKTQSRNLPALVVGEFSVRANPFAK
jgi:hypothetical protein